jgi:hypothetical protein
MRALGASMPITRARSRRGRAVCAGLAMACAIAACTSRDRSTVGGYAPAELAVIAREAREQCTAQRGVGRLPPHEFTTDGCSLFPDGQWRHCCVAHDKQYWCGGTAGQRAQADAILGACVAEASSPWMGGLMRLGVRVGGVPWLPFWFRWGYGWPWPRPYDDENARSESR